jgi:hypothetical protein
MESTLHRQLKERYAGSDASRCEVLVDGYRVDAVTPDGALVEVQSAALGPLKAKLARLLDLGHRVRVVKPVVLTRRIVRYRTPRGPVLSTRRSPRRGALLDVFDDLPGVAALLARDGATLDVLGVSIDEHRLDRRRRPGYRVLDRVLIDVLGGVTVERPADLWRLVAVNLPDAFTTRDLAASLDRPLGFAQRVAYCLRQSGAARLEGKRSNLRVYARAS